MSFRQKENPADEEFFFMVGVIRGYLDSGLKPPKDWDLASQLIKTLRRAMIKYDNGYEGCSDYTGKKKDPPQ
jgi:hypothetical protein